MSPSPLKAARARLEPREPAPLRRPAPRSASSAQPLTALAQLQAGAGNAAVAAAAARGSAALAAAEVSEDVSELQAQVGNGVIAFAAEATPAETNVSAEREEEAVEEAPDLGYDEAPKPELIAEPWAEAVAPQLEQFKEAAPGAEAPASQAPKEVAGEREKTAADKP